MRLYIELGLGLKLAKEYRPLRRRLEWLAVPCTKYESTLTSTVSVTNFYCAQRQRFRVDFEEVMVSAVREGRLDPALGLLWRLSDALKINEMLVMGEGLWRSWRHWLIRGCGRYMGGKAQLNQT